jgi:broad specificity phosphatase PhoE
VLAVTHKGVLNALVAHLTGWNAIGRPPVKPRTGCAQVVEVDARGAVTARAWNVPLVAPPPA